VAAQSRAAEKFTPFEVASQTINPCIAYETYEERDKEALVSILIKIHPFKSPKLQKIKGKTLLSKN
jgi:hypothetical protein